MLGSRHAPRDQSIEIMLCERAGDVCLMEIVEVGFDCCFLIMQHEFCQEFGVDAVLGNANAGGERLLR